MARALTVEMESSHQDSAGVPPLPVQPGISAGGEVTAGRPAHRICATETIGRWFSG